MKIYDKKTEKLRLQQKEKEIQKKEQKKKETRKRATKSGENVGEFQKNRVKYKRKKSKFQGPLYQTIHKVYTLIVHSSDSEEVSEF